MHAQTDSDSKRIQLKSDFVTGQFDGNTQLSGNVSIEQDSLRIEADEVLVSGSDTEDDLELVAKGNPVRFTQRGPEPVTASAESITFKPNQSMVVLEGNVVLEQDTNLVRGDRIEYDISAREIVAGSNEDSQVEIVLDIE